MYDRNLEVARHRPGAFTVIPKFSYDAGEHPVSYIDAECAFAATHIAAHAPESILDIGSYRHFLLGLQAHYPVTTLDVRKRRAATSNETVITSDAASLDLPDGSFDVVVSLCTLEHLGLGRYGDAFDLDADGAAMREMNRILRPGGRLIFSTAVTGGEPVLAFNELRIYTIDMLHDLCGELRAEDEQFFSMAHERSCSLDELQTAPGRFDVYLGCWVKASIATGS
jgi:SAM-dependent methyltransferase